VPVAPVSLYRSLTVRGRETRGESPSSVEIAVPDGYSAALLMGYVAPWFPAEVTSGDLWFVTLTAPTASEGEEWVFEVLALIERWLDAVPLASTSVRYGGTTCVIRASKRPGPTGQRDSLRLMPDPAA
jgi:hypothetical protein